MVPAYQLKTNDFKDIQNVLIMEHLFHILSAF